jgi:hypothetical protein
LLKEVGECCGASCGRQCREEPPGGDCIQRHPQTETAAAAEDARKFLAFSLSNANVNRRLASPRLAWFSSNGTTARRKKSSKRRMENEM